MASIIVKFQKCGKNNCHCVNADPHGPYYWFVKYIKPRNSLKKGKYKWKYIGKQPEELSNFLRDSKNINIKSSVTEIVTKSELMKLDLKDTNKEKTDKITLSFY